MHFDFSERAQWHVAVDGLQPGARAGMLDGGSGSGDGGGVVEKPPNARLSVRAPIECSTRSEFK